MVPARPAGPGLALSVWPDVTSLPASQRPLEAGGAAFPAAIKGLTRGSHVRGEADFCQFKEMPMVYVMVHITLCHQFGGGSKGGGGGGKGGKFSAL